MSQWKKTLKIKCRIREVQCKFPKGNINYFLTLLIITTNTEMMQYSLGSYHWDFQRRWILTSYNIMILIPLHWNNQTFPSCKILIIPKALLASSIPSQHVSTRQCKGKKKGKCVQCSGVFIWAEPCTKTNTTF